MLSMKRCISEVAAAILTFSSIGALLATDALGSDSYSPGVAPAQETAKRVDGDSRLPSLSLKVAMLKWIGANSEYDVTEIIAKPPTVAFCERGSTLVSEGEAVHFDDRLNGVYDPKTRRICLAEPWNAANVKNAGVLLHELVHHVQFQNRRWLCPKKTEWEAYKLQEAWLIENGATPDFNWLFILLSSSCTPRDFHPD